MAPITGCPPATPPTLPRPSLQNLPIGRAFALIALLTLLMCLPPAGMLVKEALDTMHSTRMERDGLPPLGTLLQLVRQTQSHRGASTGWLGGSDGPKAHREARAVDLDKAMAAVQAGTALCAGGRLAERRTAVLQAWQSVRDDVAARRIDGLTAFARHSALFSAQMQMLGDVADRST